ncbi:hypothetical protein DASC09_008590 [Saccharomycopsis crataegensis]|uniref:Uncharacterized protein n=1 Tax=Saccharomycopsis crataegensis TaxID=43959 RepID=A0AAV5QFM3_9ASCO|nr:hypothetical protein DASC09_008590 [Saccharomycopsis crataegensis]
MSSLFQKRVSFNNLYNDVIDPEHPRHSPKFISNNQDSSQDKKDLNFGYSVSSSSNLTPNDLSKVFKFNEFNFINQNDRFYNDLQSQKNFNEQALRKQKLKNEKLPFISKDKSILKVSGSDSYTQSVTDNRDSLYLRSSNQKFNTNSHAHDSPTSFSNVSNRFKAEDQDQITLRNTQLNINLDPNILHDALASIENETAPSSKPQQSKRKRLTEMTDEEILLLDNQFKSSSLANSDFKNAVLNDLENSIELSKFKALANSLHSASHANEKSVTTKYSKEGVNITNIFDKSYPSKPVVTYKSFVLHSQHTIFDAVRDENANFTYCPKDIILKKLNKENKISSLGSCKLLDTTEDISNLDETLGSNKTVMVYISGRKHTWSSLEYLFNAGTPATSNNNLLKDGDDLVLFTVIPSDFESIEDIINTDNETIAKSSEKKDSGNSLTRYKSTSMLDDLNSYNLRKLKSNTGSKRLLPPPPKTSRSYSSVEFELKRITSNSSSPQVESPVFSSKMKKAPTNQRKKLICDKVSLIARKLMKTIENLAERNNVIIRITVEVCSDKPLDEDLDTFYRDAATERSDKAMKSEETTPSADFYDPVLSRPLSHFKKHRDTAKIDMKFVLTNIIEVYSPDMFVIGSKPDRYSDLATNRYQNSSNCETLNSLSENFASSYSGPSSRGSSRRQSVVDEPSSSRPLFSASPSSTSVSSVNVMIGADMALRKTLTNSKLSRVNTNSSVENLWRSGTNNSHTLPHSHGVKLSEFLVQRTNIPVLIVPTDSLKYFDESQKRTLGSQHEENWMTDWTQRFIDFDGHDDSESTEFDYSDDNDNLSLHNSKSTQTEISTAHGDVDKLGLMLESISQSISNTVTGKCQLNSATGNNFRCSETFFKDMLTAASDKSFNESLNFLQNSKHSNDKQLPLTTRTRRILKRKKYVDGSKVNTHDKAGSGYGGEYVGWRKQEKSKIGNDQKVLETESDSETDGESSEDDDLDKPYYPKYLMKSQMQEPPRIHFVNIGESPRIQVSKSVTNGSSTQGSFLAKANTNSSSLTYQDILRTTKNQVGTVPKENSLKVTHASKSYKGKFKSSSRDRSSKKPGFFKKLFKK